jgi:hypothetical protein
VLLIRYPFATTDDVKPCRIYRTTTCCYSWVGPQQSAFHHCKGRHLFPKQPSITCTHPNFLPRSTFPHQEKICFFRNFPSFGVALRYPHWRDDPLRSMPLLPARHAELLPRSLEHDNSLACSSLFSAGIRVLSPLSVRVTLTSRMCSTR